MPATSAVDALLVVFEALAQDEREDAFERLSKRQLEHLAGEESDTARLLRSLRCVAEGVGHTPTVTEYRDVERRLRGTDEAIDETNQVIRHFGSWRRAREALDLSETTTARKIESRFRARRLGKVWRYTEDTLRETLERCVAHYGRPPQVAEFEWWRERELELARAQGDDALHLASPTPYRRRWESWEGALLHFGYTPAGRGRRAPRKTLSLVAIARALERRKTPPQSRRVARPRGTITACQLCLRRWRS